MCWMMLVDCLRRRGGGLDDVGVLLLMVKESPRAIWSGGCELSLYYLNVFGSIRPFLQPSLAIDLSMDLK